MATIEDADVILNLIRRDESGFAVEPDPIVGINTNECAELLSAGGNKPANSEPREVGSEYADRNSEVTNELRLAMSLACCQVHCMQYNSKDINRFEYRTMFWESKCHV